ncbi:pinin [Bacillus rossius redtenbacheri]|uniref:pinin n=1 Tax=Bacillus rossius redtenbacheri TaxID=93214 RepID=UPI002FDD0F77
MASEVITSFAALQAELEQAKNNLKGVDEHIKKIMGRDPFDGQARPGQKRPNAPAEDFRTRGLDDFRGRGLEDFRARGQEEFRGRGRGFPLSRGRREPGVRPEEDAAPAAKRKPGDPRTVFSRLSGPPKPRKDGDSGDEEEELPNKPAISSRVIFTPKELPSRQEVLAAQGTDEKSKARNRRMFGALLGTLQKFRQEETRMKEKEEKRAQVEKKLEENAKREKEELKRERQELFQERKRKQAEIRKIEFKILRIKEQEEWEAKHKFLMNFIQTRTKPHIFYLPKVQSAKTEERLVASRKAVTRMMEKKRANVQEELDALDKKGRWRQGLGEPEGRGDGREGNVNKENRLQSVGSMVKVAEVVPDAGAGKERGKERGEVRVAVKQEKVEGDKGENNVDENESESASESESDEEEVFVERVIVMKTEKGDGERLTNEQTSAEIPTEAEVVVTEEVAVGNPVEGNDTTVDTPSGET